MRSAKRQASGSKLKNKKKDFFLKLRVPVELFLIFFSNSVMCVCLIVIINRTM